MRRDQLDELRDRGGNVPRIARTAPLPLYSHRRLCARVAFAKCGLCTTPKLVEDRLCAPDGAATITSAGRLIGVHSVCSMPSTPSSVWIKKSGCRRSSAALRSRIPSASASNSRSRRSSRP